MRIRSGFVFFLLILMASSLKAKTWYVSPNTDNNGWRLEGKGTLDNPWDLQTALSGGLGNIKPGDTIYVRDGKPYWGYYQMLSNGMLCHAAQLYRSSLKGKEGMPVIVKAYPGEHPVLDGGINTSRKALISDKLSGIAPPAWVLVVSGSYTWIWGLEITNSSLNRQTYDLDTGIQLAEGVEVLEANNDKLINLIVHDNTSSGIGAFSSAINLEIEGCLIYYNGYVALPAKNPKAKKGTYRKNGPGIYSQNRNDSAVHSFKKILNNVVFQQFYNGMQIYGSSQAFVENYDIKGNTVFNNGLISYSDSAKTELSGAYNILVGSHKDGYDNRINGNQVCFFTNKPVKTSLKIGYNDKYSAIRCQVDSNDIVGNIDANRDGGPPLIINNPENSELKYNNVVGYSTDMEIVTKLAPFGSHKQVFVQNIRCDSNRYVYKINSKKPPFFIRLLSLDKIYGGTFNFINGKGMAGSWQDSFGLDNHSINTNISSYRKNPQFASKIVATPDAYEPGLVKIIIFNWDSLPEIKLNLARYVPVGNSYRLVDIQNFKAESSLKGLYTGQIIVKMNNLEAAVPTGLKASNVMVQPEHTDSRFGVYWLQFFPYQIEAEMQNGNVKSIFKDTKKNLVNNPLFMSFSWKKDGMVLEKEKGPELNTPGDGLYELIVKDDKNLEKSVSFKVAKGQIVNN